MYIYLPNTIHLIINKLNLFGIDKNSENVGFYRIQLYAILKWVARLNRERFLMLEKIHRIRI